MALRAVRHHGLVTRAQALACGMTDRQISRRLRTGRWARVGPGVYRLAGVPLTDAQRSYAAVLCAGPDAIVGGASALALLGIGAAPLVPTITRKPSASARTRGAAVRRSPVSPRDRTRVGPIPCSTPARALLEVAARPGLPLEDLVDDALDQGRTTPSSILGAIRRAGTGHGRTGAPRLRAALEPWLTGLVPGSPAEARLVRRLAQWGFPPPRLQHRVVLPSGRAALIDVAWPAHLTGLEYDGSRAHTPRELPADVEREAGLHALGWWLGRVDRHDLAPSSTRVRDELIGRLLASAA